MSEIERKRELTCQEMAERNIEAAGKFFLQLAEHPEEANQFPDNSIVIGLPHDDPALFEANLKLAMDIAKDGLEDGRRKQPIVLWPE